MMMRRLLLIGLACGLGTSVLLAKPGIVRLKDGQAIEGEIVKDEPESVTVSIRGIETAITRDRIQSVTYTEGFEQEYEKRLAALNADDAPGRIALARWAFDNRKYGLARSTLGDVLSRVDPNSAEAAELQRLVNRQIELERRTAAQAERSREPAPDDNGGNGGNAQGRQQAEIHHLPPEDIKKIKAAEVRDRESNIRLRIPNDVRRDFLQRTQMNSRDFANMTEVEKLRSIAADGTDDMIDATQIEGDPESIATFRERIQPIILQGCASAGCHNTPDAGGFMLYARPDRGDGATYTNFYILHSYSRKTEQRDEGGVFAGADNTQRMINRTNPAESLLLLYALPPAANRVSHPDVQGYRGVFRGTNDPRYTQVLGWIRSLGAFDPDYSIKYTPPGAEPEPAPAQTSPPAPVPAATPARPNPAPPR